MSEAVIKHREHLLNRLQFDGDTIVDQQVQSQTGIETKVVIYDWKHNLPLCRQAPMFQLVYEAGLVNRFKQSRPQRRVNLEGGIHNLRRGEFRFGRQRITIEFLRDHFVPSCLRGESSVQACSSSIRVPQKSLGWRKMTGLPWAPVFGSPSPSTRAPAAFIRSRAAMMSATS